MQCYRSQIEPTPPWPAAALPRELLEFCLHDPEYYFRSTIPPGENRRPLI